MTTSTAARRRPLALLVLLLAFSLLATAIAAHYWFIGQWREHTEDAYLQANLIDISAQRDGSVIWLGAEENRYVEAGQLLARLDDADALQELEQAKQRLALAVQSLLGDREQVARFETELRQREVTHALARDELQRRQRLAKRGMVSDEEQDAARTRERETAIALQIAQRQLAEARQRAGQMPLEQHPAVRLAAEQLRDSYRQWSKTRILAPVAGLIARRPAQLGQRVKTGQPLMRLVQHHSQWIEANFKETQLRHLRRGQTVSASTDLYGDELVLQGRVDSIGSGTGAQFALLPAQNATGNWIKIVQRVPVRITFDLTQLRHYPLPVGAALAVNVDTHQRAGERLQPQPLPAQMSQTLGYDYRQEQADSLIAQVFAAAQQQDAAALSASMH